MNLCDGDASVYGPSLPDKFSRFCVIWLQDTKNLNLQ